LIASKKQIDPPNSSEMGDHAPVSWAEWKADQLNRLFRDQGSTGQPAKITAETVRHGAAR